VLFYNIFKYSNLLLWQCYFYAILAVLPPTVSGLAKVAIFTTNVDAENKCLINHKCVCGAMNRHFCQTRVIGSQVPFHNTASFHVYSLLLSFELE
jgi:hypothetical protein